MRKQQDYAIDIKLNIGIIIAIVTITSTAMTIYLNQVNSFKNQMTKMEERLNLLELNYSEFTTKSMKRQSQLENKIKSSVESDEVKIINNKILELLDEIHKIRDIRANYETGFIARGNLVPAAKESIKARYQEVLMLARKINDVMYIDIANQGLK